MRIDKLFPLILAFTCSVSFATDPKKEQIAEALMWEIPVEQLVKACNTEQVKDGHFCYFAGAKTKNMPERLFFFKRHVLWDMVKDVPLHGLNLFM